MKRQDKTDKRDERLGEHKMSGKYAQTPKDKRHETEAFRKAFAIHAKARHNKSA